MSYLERDLSPIARAFYERMGTGEFCIGRCTSCGSESYPPRDICGACGAHGWELVPHPGDGTLYAFTTQELALRFGAPDVVGVVELSGGAGRAFGSVRGGYDHLEIGMPLALDPVTADGWTLPAWRPA